MQRLQRTCVTLSVMTIAVLAGCGEKPTIEMIQAEIAKERPRPTQLDHLNQFVGTWESTGEMTFPTIEGAIAYRGTSTAQWDADNRVVVERMTGEMGSSSMSGLSMFWWDDRDKVFRNLWVDSFGASIQGEAEYDAETNCWKMKGKGVDPHSGGRTSAVGTIKLVDENTMEWTHSEKNAWGITILNLKGVSKRIG